MGLLNGDDKDKKKKKGKKPPKRTAGGLLIPEIKGMPQEATAVPPSRYSAPDFGPSPVAESMGLRSSLLPGKPAEIEYDVRRAGLHNFGPFIPPEEELAPDDYRRNLVRYGTKLDWGKTSAGVDRKSEEFLADRNGGTLYKGMEVAAKTITKFNAGTKEDAQNLFDMFVYMFELPQTPEEWAAYKEWALSSKSWGDMPKGALGVEIPAGIPNLIGVPLALRDIIKDAANGEMSGWTAFDIVGAAPILGAIVPLMRVVRHADEISDAMRAAKAAGEVAAEARVVRHLPMVEVGGEVKNVDQIADAARQFAERAARMVDVSEVEAPVGKTTRWGTIRFKLRDGNWDQVSIHPPSNTPNQYYLTKADMVKLLNGDVTMQELIDSGKAMESRTVLHFNRYNPSGHGISYGGGESSYHLGQAPPPESSRGRYGAESQRAMMRNVALLFPEMRGMDLTGRATGIHSGGAEAAGNARITLRDGTRLTFHQATSRINQLLNSQYIAAGAAGPRPHVAGFAAPLQSGGTWRIESQALTPERGFLQAWVEDPVSMTFADEIARRELNADISYDTMRKAAADFIAMNMPRDLQPDRIRELEDALIAAKKGGASRQELIDLANQHFTSRGFNQGYTTNVEVFQEGLVDQVIAHVDEGSPLYSTRMYQYLTEPDIEAARTRMAAEGINPETRTLRLGAAAKQNMEPTLQRMQQDLIDATGNDQIRVYASEHPTEVDHLVITIEDGENSASMVAALTDANNASITGVAGPDYLRSVLFDQYTDQMSAHPNGVWLSHSEPSIINPHNRRALYQDYSRAVSRRAADLVLADPNLRMEDALQMARNELEIPEDMQRALALDSEIESRFGQSLSVDRQAFVNNELGGAQNILDTEYNHLKRGAREYAAAHGARRLRDRRVDNGLVSADDLTAVVDDILADPQYSLEGQLPIDMWEEHVGDVRRAVAEQASRINKSVVSERIKTAFEPGGVGYQLAQEAIANMSDAEIRNLRSGSHADDIAEQVLTSAFTPAELAQISTLHDLGLIDTYPGQMQNLMATKANQTVLDLGQQRSRRVNLQAASIAQGEEARAGLPSNALPEPDAVAEPGERVRRYTEATGTRRSSDLINSDELDSIMDTIGAELRDGATASTTLADYLLDIQRRFNVTPNTATWLLRRANQSTRTWHWSNNTIARFADAEIPAQSFGSALSALEMTGAGTEGPERMISILQNRGFSTESAENAVLASGVATSNNRFQGGSYSLPPDASPEFRSFIEDITGRRRGEPQGWEAEEIRRGRAEDAEAPHIRDGMQAEASVFLRSGQARDLEDVFDMLERSWGRPRNADMRTAVREAFNGYPQFAPQGPTGPIERVLDRNAYAVLLSGDPVHAGAVLRRAGATPEEIVYLAERVGYGGPDIERIVHNAGHPDVEVQPILEKIRSEYPLPDTGVRRRQTNTATYVEQQRAARGEPTATVGDNRPAQQPAAPAGGMGGSGAGAVSMASGSLRPDFASALYALQEARQQGITDMREYLLARGMSNDATDWAISVGDQYPGDANLADRLFAEQLTNRGWSPSDPLPEDDIRQALRGEGYDPSFTENILSHLRTFLADESGTKWLRGRRNAEDRVREGIRFYRSQGVPDSEIPTRLASEGMDQNLILGVMREEYPGGIPEMRAREAGAAPEQPRGMSRRSFTGLLGMGAAGVATGANGLLGRALESGAARATPLPGLNWQIPSAAEAAASRWGRMYVAYPEMGREAYMSTFLGDPTGYNPTGFRGALGDVDPGEVFRVWEQMPGGGPSLGPDHPLYPRVGGWLEEGAPQHPLFSRSQLETIQRNILPPQMGDYNWRTRGQAGGRGGESFNHVRQRLKPEDVTDLDRAVAERHNARVAQSENLTEDYSVGSTTSQAGADPTERYIVSPSKDWETTIDARDGMITPEDVAAFRIAQGENLTEGRYIGTWYNPEDGQVYLDISEGYDYPTLARRVAREADQAGFYDFPTGRFMATENTGTYGPAGRPAGRTTTAERAARDAEIARQQLEYWRGMAENPQHAARAAEEIPRWEEELARAERQLEAVQAGRDPVDEFWSGYYPETPPQPEQGGRLLDPEGVVFGTFDQPLLPGRPTLPPEGPVPPEGYIRGYRGVGVRNQPDPRRGPTQGTWYSTNPYLAEGYASPAQGDAALLGIDVPVERMPRGPAGVMRLNSEDMGAARTVRGSVRRGMQDNPAANRFRPDPRKALLPSLIGAGYLSARRYGLLGPEEEEQPALYRQGPFF